MVLKYQIKNYQAHAKYNAFCQGDEKMAGLVNIGEMGALALHLLTELAAVKDADRDAKLAVKDFAEFLHASHHTLHKVARRLVKAGFADGARGAGGGLRLLADPADITMLQAIEEVEGKIHCNDCMFAKRVCPSDAKCPFSALTSGMDSAIRNYLQKTTIADLCRMARKTGNTRIQQLIGSEIATAIEKED
jgi:Predicted transcriptional regulator